MPLPSMNLDEHKAVLVIRMNYRIARRASRAFFPGQKLGDAFTVRAVGARVLLASLCGRRITASAIAREIELPRSTVQRRLQELIDGGLVRRDGRGYVATDKANVRAFKRDLDDIIADIITVAKKLEQIHDQPSSNWLSKSNRQNAQT
jgi:predicted transcriptional regulator